MTGVYVDINDTSNTTLKMCYTEILTKINKASKIFLQSIFFKRCLISSIKHLLFL